ncbi:hypothetical protein BGW42_005667 [Actinomortierella wolfii]|nr:hypothetical protein BGW42_005667 [Actinomortierella wolfii]
MGTQKRLSTVLCAAANKKHIYIAAYETNSASSLTLYLLQSNAYPTSLQQLTWTPVTYRSMYYTHLIGRKRRPLLNACAVDDSGSFILLSHDTAPKAISVRAPSAVYNNAQWDEVPRGLFFDPYWTRSWENVDVSPDYGCFSRLGCQTLIYASNSGGQSTFVSAHYSTNASDPSASPFISFSVFDKASQQFVRQTPEIEINLETYPSKQIGFHNEQLLIYSEEDTWPRAIKTRSYSLDHRGLPNRVHPEINHGSSYGDSNGTLAAFDIRHAGSANGHFTFVHQGPDRSNSGIYTIDGSQLTKATSFEQSPTTPMLPLEFVVPVPVAEESDGSSPSPQWVIGFSGSNSYGIWMDGPQAGQWHRRDPTNIYIEEPSKLMDRTLVGFSILGYFILVLGCVLFCIRRRQRLKKMHSDSIYEYGRKQSYP